MTATLSILGLYDYDPTIFDLMTLPAGIDKDQVRDNILLQGADFEVLYPDPVFMKQAIKRWADKWYFTFERWHKALLIEYDPLNNYDRYEEYEDTEKSTRSDSGRNEMVRESAGDMTGLNTESADSSVSESSTGSTSGTSASSSTGSTSASGTTAHDISAYDSATMRENTKDTSSSSGNDSSSTSGNTSTSSTDAKTSTGTNAISGSSSSTTNNSESGTDTTSSSGKTDRNLKHKAHLYGNIGVTTSQQMLESELNVVRFNLVEQITDCFVTEFCLMIY